MKRFSTLNQEADKLSLLVRLLLSNKPALEGFGGKFCSQKASPDNIGKTQVTPHEHIIDIT